MQIAYIVRIGGKLALTAGLVCSSLVFGDSLSLFYGSAPSTFGVAQPSDPFAKQNVGFTPQTSMISTTTQNSLFAAPAGTGSSLATSYGYSAPAQNTNLSGNAVGTSVLATNTYSAPSSTPQPATNALAMPQSSMSLFTGYALGAAMPANTNAASTLPAYTSTVNTPALTGGGINLFAPVRVADLFTGPVAAKPVSLNLQVSRLGLAPDAAPEPSTWVGMSVGLAFVILKLRRRLA